MARGGEAEPRGSQWHEQAFTLALFPTAKPQGVALGIQRRMTWQDLTVLCAERRQGDKDGAGFCAAEFCSDSAGQVRRQAKNLRARTLVVLDIESCEETGEIPPPLCQVRTRLEELGVAGLLYTSHNHRADKPRFRIILPLAEPISCELPVIEIVAERLQLSGVLDRTKLGASSLFYLPSCEPSSIGVHETVLVDGEPLDTAWLAQAGGDLLARREAERQHQRAQAMEAAAQRCQHGKDRTGDDASNLIGAIRGRLDLHVELTAHGYEPAGAGRYMFPESRSGIAGVCVMTGRDGIDRVYSHHAGDPLAAANLPDWCQVHAIDVVDVKAILDYGGDRRKALRDLAKRFGICGKQARARQKQPARESAGKKSGSGQAVGAALALVSDEAGRTQRCEHKQPVIAGSETDASLITEHRGALAFARKHQGHLRYCHHEGCWFVRTGTKWEKDATRKAFNYARDLAAELGADADKRVKTTVEKAAFARAVESYAQADPTFAATADSWNRDPWLLGTPGGTVDLRTGALQEADRADYITNSTIVAPAPPGTPHPIWSKFLHEATGGDPALQAFLQRFSGYCLTGDVSEEVVAFSYGEGGTGKGTFVRVLTTILGGYAVAVPVEAFTAGARLNLEYYRAQMAPARLITASETEGGAAWAESSIKEMTGNETPLSARHPYGKPFTFRPRFKILLVGNHAPSLKGRSSAMERRLRIVPFKHKPAHPDPTLKERLKSEYPAILRWMIDGCLVWQQQGLGTCPAITAETSAHFDQQDQFSRWVDERCRQGTSVSPVSERPGKLLADFQTWARENGEAGLTSNEFREAVERSLGLKYVKVRGVQWVRGLALQPENDGNRWGGGTDTGS